MSTVLHALRLSEGSRYTDQCHPAGDGVQDQDFQAAAELAFELGHAGRLLAVVESALSQGADSAQAILGALVRGLSPEQLKQCLEYARDWNTNSRRCHAAQALLQAVITEHTAEVLHGHVSHCLLGAICSTYVWMRIVMSSLLGALQSRIAEMSV